jgi:ComF family protein
MTGDWLTVAVDAVLVVVLAPACAACEEPLQHPTAGPVCDRCWRSIVPLTPPLCDRCGDPLPAWRSASGRLAWCARCRRAPRWVDRGRAVGAYDGALRAIVHALKYDGRRSLAKPLAALMRERSADLLDGAAYVVPVPLHPSRRRHRGFNQAVDLARHIGLPVVQALRRVRATATQTGLAAAQRHRNVRGAFATTAAARALAGTTVLLIDDVSTTGATLDACARTLKEAGVAEVRALTAARTAVRGTAV